MIFFTEIAVNGYAHYEAIIIDDFYEQLRYDKLFKVAHHYLYKVAIKGSHCNFGFLLPAAATQKLAPTSEATIRMP